jgi:hypothetical protein
LKRIENEKAQLLLEKQKEAEEIQRREWERLEIASQEAKSKREEGALRRKRERERLAEENKERELKEAERTILLQAELSLKKVCISF